MTCGYRVRLFDPEEVLECVRDSHLDDAWHSTGTQGFRKTDEGEFLVAEIALIHEEGKEV